MLARLAHLIARRRWYVIGVWIVLTLFGGFAAGQVSKRWFQSFSIPGKSAYESDQRTFADLPYGDPPAERRRVPHERRRDEERRDQAGDGSRVGTHRPGRGRARTSRRRTRCTCRATSTRPSWRSIPPGQSTFDSKSGAEKMRDAAAKGLPAGITVNVTGHDPLEEASTHGASGGPGVFLEAVVGGIGALVILFFVFGTLPAVLMPIVVAVAAILNTFTLVWILTYITDVSIIVQFLIALVGLGVAIDYALLMIFRFRDELREGEDVETALVETMTHAGRSVIVSGSTVAVGLLSLVILPLPFIRSMGIGGMLIPAVSVIAAITLLPAMLAVARDAHQQRAAPAEALRRPRAPGGRHVGPLGALRQPQAGGRGGHRPRDRRDPRGDRHAAEPERVRAEELPRHRHRDRRAADARRRRTSRRA